MPWSQESEFVQCSVDGCTGRAKVPGSARGFCRKHYGRLKRTGSPLGSKPRPIGHVERWVHDVALACDHDDCLVWPFTTSSKGYAHWTVDGRPQSASRLIYRMANGEPPTPKHVAAHSCFNGHLGCVNPRHLRWATASENEMDKVDSGTSNRGSRHGMSKLSESDVRQIRSLKGIMTQQEIGEKFGVSKWTVGDIIRGNRWGWLT